MNDSFLLAADRSSHTKIAAFSSGRGPPSRLRRAHGLDATTCPAEALAQRGSFIVVGFSRYQ
jgi:hypothetical protein